MRRKIKRGKMRRKRMRKIMRKIMREKMRKTQKMKRYMFCIAGFCIACCAIFITFGLFIKDENEGIPPIRKREKKR
jgi:hypothetical protein